ncbi:MAG: hypothetical protein R3B45_05625 [Bdellovibrionota bacterium]
MFKNLSNNLFRVNRKNPEFIPPEEISYNPLQQKVMIGFEEIRGFSIQIRSIGFTGKKISNLPVYRISVDKSKEGQASIMATSISLETTEDSDFYESFFIGSLPDVKSWNHEKDKVFADHSSYVERGQFIGKSGVDKFSFNYLDLTESSKNLPNIKDLGCR